MVTLAAHLAQAASAIGRKMESDIGVAKNWSVGSAARALKQS